MSSIALPLIAAIVTLLLGIYFLSTAKPDETDKRVNGLFFILLAVFNWTSVQGSVTRQGLSAHQTDLIQRLEVLDNNVRVYGKMTGEMHDSYTRINNMLKGKKDGTKEDSNKVEGAESLRGLDKEGK